MNLDPQVIMWTRRIVLLFPMERFATMAPLLTRLLITLATTETLVRGHAEVTGVGMGKYQLVVIIIILLYMCNFMDTIIIICNCK